MRNLLEFSIRKFQPKEAMVSINFSKILSKIWSISVRNTSMKLKKMNLRILEQRKDSKGVSKK